MRQLSGEVPELTMLLLQHAGEKTEQAGEGWQPYSQLPEPPDKVPEFAGDVKKLVEYSEQLLAHFHEFTGEIHQLGAGSLKCRI